MDRSPSVGWGPVHLLASFFFTLLCHARKDVNLMAKFVSREKLSKKARKELDNQKRTVWAFSSVTKKVESKKLYNRKKAQHLN